MTGSELARKQALFQRCLDRPAEEWDAILDDACGEDTVLRDHVRRMLDRHRDTHAEESGFMRLQGSDPERIGP
ncbi:MAG: hypothetical protein KY410_00140, partial [Proteobacteria bacterium]|nr:hypothetical protein [Pseudomonadota bacterium]